MIHLNPEARLNILLPNMNKVLGEVISNATPEQLEILKEGKDLKSLLTSIFQDKFSSIKSDTVLLDILKNSTPFKTMGNFSENLRSLIKELKTSPELSTKTIILEKFLKDITLMDAQTLKNQMTNSGVFMESKFAAAMQKIPNLIKKFDHLNVVQETKVS
ncbi:hypothetical protein, partial [Sulfuricurvum sp.]|uniref:hypothetical protein n=1 Tax=Sulfuricurvum sp. TaxID=2025608 RepID=UPI003BB5A9DC